MNHDDMIELLTEQYKKGVTKASKSPKPSRAWYSITEEEREARQDKMQRGRILKKKEFERKNALLKAVINGTITQEEYTAQTRKEDEAKVEELKRRLADTLKAMEEVFTEQGLPIPEIKVSSYKLIMKAIKEQIESKYYYLDHQ